MRLLIYLLFTVCIVNCFTIKNGDVKGPGEWSERLLDDITPHSYDIFVTTNIHDAVFDFNGKVIIHITSNKSTSLILLHSYLLTLNEIKVTTIDGIVIGTTFVMNEETHQVRIDTTTTLQLDQQYVIEIDYSGNLRTDDVGFYRSSYYDEDNNLVWLATTKFEPFHARSAFPCFDEPKFRATFTIHIDHHNSYHAISNMDVSSLITDEERSLTSFQTTPPMPTYLVVYIISQFGSIGNEGTPNEIPQRVFAPPKSIDHAQYALQSGIDIIEAQQNYFSFDYILPKLDQAAIPDFAAGAMENWGLVTYRTAYLLFEEGVTNENYRRIIATTIAHEYAHNFFGNHVTISWWTYLWLNEGFATLYENFIADIVFPEMRLRERIAIDSIQYSLRYDASDNIRPMTHYVDELPDIKALFNFIAYDKSGSVLRMFNYAFQESTFVKGINYYLNEMSLGIASADDLSRNIQRAVTEDGTLSAELTVAEIMNSWTSQSGFPLVTVTRDYETGVVTLSQERYLLTGTNNSQTMWIPYNFASSNRRNFVDTSPIGWIPKESVSIDLLSTDEVNWSSGDWLLFNIQQTGYYRVNYDDVNWLLLAAELQEGDFEDIVPVNRAQLIDDSASLSDSGHLDYTISDEILAYLGRETDYIVLLAATKRLNFLNKILVGQSYHNDYKRYALSLIENAFNTYGTDEKEGDSHSDKVARNLVMKIACELGSQSCLMKAYEKFTSFIQSGIKIEPELKETVLCNGLRQSKTEFRSLFNSLFTSNSASERYHLINGLSCVDDNELLTELLNAGFSSSILHSTEKMLLIKSVSESGLIGLKSSIDFIETNYEYLLDVEENLLFESMQDMSELISTPQLSTKFSSILSKLSKNVKRLSLTQTGADYNIEWLERNGLKFQKAMIKFL